MRSEEFSLLELQAPYAALADVVAKALGVDPAKGLSTGEVEVRRARYGKNLLQKVRPRPAWRIFVDQFTSIVVLLLAVAALIAWITRDHLEAAAILVVLILNAAIGFFMEWRAVRALEALHRQSQIKARVRRDDHERMIPAEQIVPGDIVILNAGDRVAADARLVEANDLRTEESTLTGESNTVAKSVDAVAPDALLAERQSMVYLGTTVVAGRAVAVVVATGEKTELGKIGKLVAEAPDERAPLEQKLAELGRRLVYIVIGIAVVVMLTGWARGTSWWVMVEVSISLAVAAVPEGLPAVTTLTLALGVLRLARHNAIIRRLPAVETLGSATIICSDKTGTLTENRMTVREYLLSDGRVVTLHDHQHERGSNDDLFRRVLRVTVLCNEASLDHHAAQKHNVGDPTEIALLVAAHSLGIDLQKERQEYLKIAERPFDAASMRMITVHRHQKETLAALKGAPAVVLGVCSHYIGAANEILPLDDRLRSHFLNANENLADRAMRVLALGEKKLSGTPEKAQLKDDYVFLGMVGMIDPPRRGVAKAIREAREAGIRVVMLTGDQINTGKAIARELNLGDHRGLIALHARDLEGKQPAELATLARSVDVFARVSPEDKLHIVEALRVAGDIVAVTGDGVNDAPALKAADIGIAMGKRGTEVAKEAADVVLVDDNFATIVRAIEGGRAIYANIIKFVHMLFSHNLGEVLAIFVAIVIGFPLPLLPLQILWMNLVTDVFPALALALEPPTPEVMHHPPRSPQRAMLSKQFLILIGWQAGMIAAITLVAYKWALQTYGPGKHARTIALFVLISAELGHFFNCRSRINSAFHGLLRRPFVWLAAASVVVLQLLALYLPMLARVLNTDRPVPVDWIVFGVSVVLPIAVVELTKLYARHRRHNDTLEVPG